jgi:hypothetical protein
MSTQVIKGHSSKWMINSADSVMLLIDHQSGLFQLVRDMEQPELKCSSSDLT